MKEAERVVLEFVDGNGEARLRDSNSWAVRWERFLPRARSISARSGSVRSEVQGIWRSKTCI